MFYIFFFVLCLLFYCQEILAKRLAKSGQKNKSRRRVRAAPAPHLGAHCISLCGAVADEWPDSARPPRCTGGYSSTWVTTTLNITNPISMRT